jgi:hypothetical protein
MSEDELEIKDLEDHVKTLQNNLKEAYQSHLDAGNDAGDRWNRVRELREKIDRVNGSIRDLRSALPDASNIQVYVICGTKSRVQRNVGELFKMIDNDRYDEQLKQRWKPFRTGPYILEMLEELKAQGYLFELCFLDEHDEGSDTRTDVLVEIDTNMHKSIAIIDLLSIDEQNKPFAQQFNRQAVGYLMLPYCRDLNAEVRAFMDKKRKEVYSIPEALVCKSPGSCSFYEWEVGVKESFIKHIIEGFFSRFRIVNRLNITDPRREKIRTLSVNNLQ